MARASVDLPDPLDKSSAGGAGFSADDLLAQMAGEEIDRLLAEAEIETGVSVDPVEEDFSAPVHPTHARESLDPLLREMADQEVERAEQSAQAKLTEPLTETSPASTGSANPLVGSAIKPPETVQEVDEQTAAKLNELFKQLEEEAPPAPAATVNSPPATPASAPVGAPTTPQPLAAAPAEPSSGPITKQLDDIFAQLEQKPPSVDLSGLVENTEPANAPTATAAARVEKVEKATAAAKAAPLTPAEQAGELEKQVLSQELMEATALLGISPDAPAEPAQEAPAKEPRTPFYLWPLVLINAPLERYSEALRDMLGKVALMTLFNALALLSYVLFVRHK